MDVTEATIFNLRYMKSAGKLLGRKLYLDWDDQVVAITVYKKGYEPIEFTKDDGFTVSGLKGKRIPQIVDIVELVGNVCERNQQETAMVYHYGKEMNQYLYEGFYGKNDNFE